MHNESPLTTHENTPAADSVDGSTTPSANTNPDFAIDPVLLAMSFTNATQSPPRDFGAMFVPATSSNGSASTAAEPLTLQVDVPSSEPERRVGEQGMSIETAQDLFVAQMVANQDPMAAASTLLEFASTTASSSSANATNAMCTPAPSIVERPPVTERSSMQQAMSRLPHNFFQQPPPHTAPSNAPTEGPTKSGPARASQVVPASLRRMPTANKQDILAKARERRRQLVGEIDRAKVELWETTIEQGVLAQFVKEKL
jgi:hypothetical protein